MVHLKRTLHFSSTLTFLLTFTSLSSHSCSHTIPASNLNTSLLPLLSFTFSSPPNSPISLPLSSSASPSSSKSTPHCPTTPHTPSVNPAFPYPFHSPTFLSLPLTAPILRSLLFFPPIQDS